MHHPAVFNWHTRHGGAWQPAVGGRDLVVPKVLEGAWDITGLWRETGRKVVHHWHIGKIEPSGSPGSEVVVVHWEVAVAIGIGARRGDVGRIKDVCIDKVELK